MDPAFLSTIEGHPFLSDLPHEYVVSMAEYAMETRFEEGEMIFQQHDTANRFYLITKGQVELRSTGTSQEYWIENVGAGDVLGWSWMFEPKEWQFDAWAETPVDAIFFYATPILALCEEDPKMGYEMMRWSASVMLRRLQAVRNRLAVNLSTSPGALPDLPPPEKSTSFCGIPIPHSPLPSGVR